MLSATGCGGGGGGEGSSAPSVYRSINWQAVTVNEDGSPLNDLAGYRIYYGTALGQYPYVVDVGLQTSYAIGSVISGTYCFAIAAYDSMGNEGKLSDGVCKKIN